MCCAWFGAGGGSGETLEAWVHHPGSGGGGAGLWVESSSLEVGPFILGTGEGEAT